ncbi:MAG: hypothetical protein H6684_16005 [Deltaproteobacteria bacterium]|nr:hypothetical protein [Deltaproteobacteria bacterium]
MTTQIAAAVRRSAPPPTWREMRPGERVAALALYLLALGTHLLPEYGNHVVRQNPHLIPLVPLLFVGALVVRQRLRASSAGRVAVRLWQVVYYGLLAVYMAFLTYGLAVLDWWLPWVLMAWAPAAALWIRLGRGRWYLAAHILVVAPVFLLVARHTPAPAWTVGAVYVVYASLIGGAVAWPRVSRFVGGLPVVFLVAGTILYATLYARYQGVYPDRIPEITAQPGVRLVYDYREDADGKVGSHFMFAAKLGDGYLLGPHDPQEHFVYLSRANPAAPWNVEREHIWTRAGDMAVYDPADPNVAYVGGWGTLFKLATDPFRIVHRIEVGAGMLNTLALDADGRRLIASQDGGRTVWRFDLDNPTDVVESEAIPENLRLFDADVDGVRGRFYVNAMGLDGNVIFEGNLDTMRLTRSLALPDVHGWFFAVDPAARRAYVFGSFSGEMVTVDLEQWAEVRRTRLGSGIRNGTWDAKRGLLYISRYLNGEIIVYDPKDDAVIKKLEVGPVARHLSLTPDGDRLVVRTAAGIFEVDLEAALTRRSEKP